MRTVTGNARGQVAGLIAAGRGQDPLLFDLGSETYSTISMSTEGGCLSYAAHHIATAS